MIPLTHYHDWLVELRRYFHQYPELAFKEEKTSAKIRNVLDELNVGYQHGMAKTGIVAKLKSVNPGPVVAFRCDMDALPIDEPPDIPYRSKHSGLMHACGHDAHVTIGLGIIRMLTENGWRQNGCGRILFIFQPAEEGYGGAQEMLNSGLFDNEPVQAVFAGHLQPEYPAGHIATAPGPFHASADSISIRLIGKGGHGARPEQCRDVILVGSHLVMQMQSIVSRNISALESVVLTVGSFHAGTASNIIPEEAFLKCTLRTLIPEVRNSVISRLKDILKGLETGYGIRAEMDIRDGYPVQCNDAELFRHVETCAIELLGKDYMHLKLPSMGAEDFTFFSTRWPGIMICIGCHDPLKGFQHDLHSPHFNPDERCLDVGVRLFSEVMTKWIKLHEA